MLQVRTLAAGEKISEPGVYSLSMEAYHGQPTAGPSVSSTGFRTILPPLSPKHFWHSWSANPNAEKFAESPSMRRGRLAHHLLLGEGDFNSTFSVRPDHWDSWRTDAAKRWHDKQIIGGMTPVEPKDVEDVRGIALSLSQHPLIMAGAMNGDIERSLIWQDEETGLWLKARPDAIPNDSGDFVDLKLTAGGLDDDSLQRAIGNFGYHIQGATVGMAARHVLGIEMQSFTLFFTESKAPWAVRPVEVDQVDIALGYQQIRAALRQIKWCMDRNYWPGPGGNDVRKLSLKPWDRTRIENDVILINQDIGATQ